MSSLDLFVDFAEEVLVTALIHKIGRGRRFGHSSFLLKCLAIQSVRVEMTLSWRFGLHGFNFSWTLSSVIQPIIHLFLGGNVVYFGPLVEYLFTGFERPVLSALCLHLLLASLYHVEVLSLVEPLLVLNELCHLPWTSSLFGVLHLRLEGAAL